MKPAEIIERVIADGLTLSISHDGNIKITGDQSAIDNWLTEIRENKAGILAELQSQRTLEELAGAIEKKYVVVVNDASTDPVLVKVSIKGIGTFDMEIPKAHYDGIALLEVIEQYSAEAEPQQEAA